MITLNQLRIFWAVAHGDSLTRAAKQLGVTQPALSQQLAKLETALGGQLFDRVNNQLILTDAGRFLLRKAETVLAEMDEAEAGLADFRLGRRRRIAVGALASLARTIVPEAFRLALELVPDLELDLHELAPAEALEQLYGRNLQLALLSSVSLAANRVSFTRIDIARDPYVLAAPRGLDLGRIHTPETELSPEHQRILNRSIQFNFGNLHNQRVDEWYRRVLPRHQVAACCRTYELALAMVQARPRRGAGPAVQHPARRAGGLRCRPLCGAGAGAADRGADPAAISPRPAVRGVSRLPQAGGRRADAADGRPDAAVSGHRAPAGGGTPTNGRVAGYRRISGYLWNRKLAARVFGDHIGGAGVDCAARAFSRETAMTKKIWQAPKVETTPVSMEVTMYLPAQA